MGNHKFSFASIRRKAAVAVFAAACGCVAAAGPALARQDASAASGGASAKQVRPALDTSVSPGRFFSAGRHAVTYKFRAHGVDGPVRVTIKLVRRSGQVVIRTWKRKLKDDGWHTVHWDGTDHGSLLDDGSYAFRITATANDGSALKSASSSGQNRVTMHNFAFPVHGWHDFGSAGNRFGAPRSGHTHQGQDIMSNCGTPIVAARGGIVKKNAYQSAAGNYLVISGQGTGQDYVYMHMPRLSKHAEGSRVYTGQQIGVVGQTGDATACHLHFEMWTSPGWYSGGHPFDPLPSLERWDRYS